MTLSDTTVSLKDRLVRYFKKQPDTWVAKGNLQRLVAQQTSYTPENVGRRLRELENEGVIEVKYESNHAWYRIKQEEFSNARALEVFETL